LHKKCWLFKDCDRQQVENFIKKVIDSATPLFILDALRDGKSLRSISRQFTVSLMWVTRFRNCLGALLPDAPDAKSESLGSYTRLISRIDNLLLCIDSGLLSTLGENQLTVRRARLVYFCEWRAGGLYRIYQIGRDLGKGRQGHF
jgi:hypothetical protein